MMIPTGAAELDLGDRRVAEDRPLRDQLAVLDAHAGDLHRDAGASRAARPAPISKPSRPPPNSA